MRPTVVPLRPGLILRASVSCRPVLPPTRVILIDREVGFGRLPMNRRFQFAVVASSTCLVVLLLFGAVRGRSASTDSPYNHLGVYSEVLSRIKADYVEEPDMKAVTVGAINGMLESIDPYASYLNADQYKQYLKSKETAPKAGRRPDPVAPLRISERRSTRCPVRPRPKASSPPAT